VAVSWRYTPYRRDIPAVPGALSTRGALCPAGFLARTLPDVLALEAGRVGELHLRALHADVLEAALESRPGGRIRFSYKKPNQSIGSRRGARTRASSLPGTCIKLMSLK
jgi:hypothetical protein